MNHESNEVNEAVAGELGLMDAHMRASRIVAGELLEREFVEVGASGQRWAFEKVLAELPGMAGRVEEPHY
ncbi:hypothetical protein [Streptomyces sp. NPDC048191]|uniref:hypothetical protein n=1 Tax=Streptomyces sp. NPDC048191 TaxID=3155484 RepID=UPI0033D8A26B